VCGIKKERKKESTLYQHFTSTVLCTGYVVNKTVSCVLMNVILGTNI
jgi:hypothetical protein